MVEEAQRELKINKVCKTISNQFVYSFVSILYYFFFLQKQARRIYEILRFLSTDVANVEEYRAYRLDVKRRLNIPYQVCTTVMFECKI